MTPFSNECLLQGFEISLLLTDGSQTEYQMIVIIPAPISKNAVCAFQNTYKLLSLTFLKKLRGDQCSPITKAVQYLYSIIIIIKHYISHPDAERL